MTDSDEKNDLALSTQTFLVRRHGARVRVHTDRVVGSQRDRILVELTIEGGGQHAVFDSASLDDLDAVLSIAVDAFVETARIRSGVAA